ncbi:hypothetical protein [Streptomyces sp. NPDC014676]|uniref:hypothetical protein n=1 Tax=Streptomyces sp. NPDC014676 TaxID=3364879 RepID=UPI0036FF8EEE
MRTAPVSGHAGPPADAVLDGGTSGHPLSGPPEAPLPAERDDRTVLPPYPDGRPSTGPPPRATETPR